MKATDSNILKKTGCAFWAFCKLIYVCKAFNQTNYIKYVCTLHNHNTKSCSSTWEDYNKISYIFCSISDTSFIEKLKYCRFFCFCFVFCDYESLGQI